ncbi:MAG: glycosyltransferase family 4 protein [Planctomycetota bacterium]
MRVLILNQFYVPDISPTAHLAASLAEDRAARGDQVTVMTSHGGYVAPHEPVVLGTKPNPNVIRLWTPEFGKSSHLRRLVDYASYYSLALLRTATMPKQDVIISLTTPPFIALAGVLHKAAHPDTRLILWNMDCYPDVVERTKMLSRGGFISALLRRINRMIFERIDHLVGLDTAMVELLRSQYGSRTLPATIIPNWENAALFSEENRSKSNACKIAHAGTKFTILYLGNIGYGHSFETVLDAAELLRNESVQFAFYGGGARAYALEKSRLARGLDNVVMHSYVKKEYTPALMASADCALITLRDDALGVMSPSKMHSNLAMRLPIIYVGPETSNVDDAIKRFACGVSLRHGQSEELAAFVRTMIADKNALEAMRSRARHAFDEAYCDAKTLPLFDAVIKDRA